MQTLVKVRLLVGMLVGSCFKPIGTVLSMDEDRAKHLAAKKPPACKILGEAEAEQPLDFAAIDPPDSAVAETNEAETTGGKKKAEKPQATPLADVGITGKTAKLLVDGGFDTVEKVRQAIADGVDLAAEINGLGPKSVASVLAALQA